MTVHLITHAVEGDTFWDFVRTGAEEAADKNNVNLVYNSHQEGAEQAELIQAALDSGTDGIAVTMAKADAMMPYVERALEADVPVVSLNAGEEVAFDAGVFAHFGQNDRLAGETVGERLEEEGLENVICMIHEQGHVGLENRCDGIRSVIPDTENLYVEGSDMTQVASTATASLETNQDADAIVGVGAPYSATLIDVIADTGSDVELVSFDINEELLQAIDEGDLLFTTDQQPWLQGYLAVDSLWLHSVGSFEPGGGSPVLTGPSIVDADNVETLMEHAAEGLR